MRRIASVLAAATVATSLSGCQLVADVLLDEGGMLPAEGVCASYEVVDGDGGLAAPDAIDQTRQIMEQRVGATGLAEAVVIVDDEGLLRLGLPGITPDGGLAQELRTLVTAPGVLEFTPVPSECAEEVVPQAPQPACLDRVEPLFDGTAIAAAHLGQDEAIGEMVVDIELDEIASRRFDEYAGEVYQSPDPNDRLFAIVLDGIVESAPSINAPRFEGQAQISGNFTPDEASKLVTILLSGSLPLEIREVGFGACEGAG